MSSVSHFSGTALHKRQVKICPAKSRHITYNLKDSWFIIPYNRVPLLSNDRKIAKYNTEPPALNHLFSYPSIEDSIYPVMSLEMHLVHQYPCLSL